MNFNYWNTFSKIITFSILSTLPVALLYTEGGSSLALRASYAAVVGRQNPE